MGSVSYHGIPGQASLAATTSCLAVHRFLLDVRPCPCPTLSICGIPTFSALLFHTQLTFVRTDGRLCIYADAGGVVGGQMIEHLGSICA
jgi:hypothetical protein